MRRHTLISSFIVLALCTVVLSNTNDLNYFPMQEGLSWFYKAIEGMGGKAVDHIETATRKGYRFSSYNGTGRTFIKSGAQVFEIRIKEDGTLERRLWYDFSTDVGTQWTIEPFKNAEGDLMDGTTVTVAGIGEKIRTSVGTTYEGVLHFSFKPAPGIADAGLLEEWFAPGVGCVKRIVQTIAGPAVYELVGIEQIEEPFPLSLEIRTDQDRVEAGEDIGIHITVWNRNDRDETLQFRSGLQADYIIDGVYRWSVDRVFTMALTSVTVPGGGSYTWDFVHRPEDWKIPPGMPTIIGMVVGYPLKAQTHVTVGPLSTIRGTVTDEAGGPIPDVMVYAYPAAMDGIYTEEGEEVKSDGIGLPGQTGRAESGAPEVPMPPVPAPWRSYQTMTDETGAFLLHIPLNQTILIWAYKEGYDPIQAEVLVNQETVNVALTLHRTVYGIINGQVLDEDGHPLSEVELSAYVEPTFFEELPPRRSYDDGEVADQSGESDPMPSMPESILQFKAISDMEGRFTIQDMPVGRTVVLNAHKRGYEPAYTRIEMSAEEVEARLMLFRQDDRYPNLIAQVREGIRYEIAVDGEVYRPEDILHMRYRVTNVDRPSVTFTFPTGQQHEFVLRSPDGQEVWRWSKGKGFTEAFSTRTLHQGESMAFEEALHLSTLPVKEWGFMLSAYLPVIKEEGEIQPRETEIYVKFIIEREPPNPVKAVLEGIVTEDTSPLEIWVPLSGATLIARLASVEFEGPIPPEGDREQHIAVTDEKGYFVLEGLTRGGTYEVMAFKDGYEPQTKIVYAIQDQHRVHFALKPVGSEGTYNNIAHRVDRGIRYELATDRHFYGPRDTVRMRYTVTNLRETPVAFFFKSGQQFDFVLRKATTPESSLPREEIWRWSANKRFAMMITEHPLAPGESMVFQEKLSLGSLEHPAQGALILSGVLTNAEPSDDLVLNGEEPGREWAPTSTEVSVELVVGDQHEAVDTGSYDAERPAEARSGLGIYIELYTPFGGIKGQIEFSETFTNTFADLAGHIFLKMVNFEPSPLLKALIQRAYVEVSYDDDLLARFGIKDEEQLGLFFWDISSEPARWNRVEGGVNTEENIVWGEVLGAPQLALFASEPTAISEEEAALPSQFSLSQNHPNPFNPTTTIPFSVPGTNLRPDVRLVLYNALGQPVRTLVHDPMEPGAHQVVWDGRDDQGIPVSSGIYLYRLSVGERAETRKMVWIE